MLLLTVAISPSYAKETNSNSEGATIEVFIIETFSKDKNENGLYERTGFKKVNSSTQIKSSYEGLPIQISVSYIEDYYDEEANYISTLVKSTEITNDFDEGTAKIKGKEKTYNEPSTFLTNIDIDHKNITYKKINLQNESQEDRVKFNISSYLSDIKDEKIKTENGLNREQMNELRRISKEVSEKIAKGIDVSILSLENAGAFDNYYNHDTSTGWFRVQALSAVDSNYIRYEGSTSGSTKNATGVANFKTYINAYEGYIIDDMEAATWPEVVGYASVIAIFVFLVVGYVTGPPGWIAIVLGYGSALTLFAGLTTTAYSTYARLTLSYNAQVNLENARTMIFYGANHFESYTADYSVSGF
jgi:hypothetical protein